MRKLFTCQAVLGLLFLCVVVASGIYWFTEIRPQHFRLDFPVMEGMHKYVLEEYGVWTVYPTKRFVWQQGASCHRVDCVDFDTIVSFFDISLEELGWERLDLCGNPCLGVLREASFIQKGILDGVYLGYRPDNEDTPSSPAVCIALWSDGDFYEIKVMTQVTRIYPSYFD